MDNTNVTPEMTEQKSTGSVVGAIIIVVILILGGLYFWGQKLDQNGTTDTATSTTETATTTDEMGAIEGDLNNVGSVIDAIDATTTEAR